MYLNGTICFSVWEMRNYRRIKRRFVILYLAGLQGNICGLTVCSQMNLASNFSKPF